MSDPPASDGTIRVTVQYFGVLRGLVGFREQELEVQGADVAAVVEAVVAAHSSLSSLPTALRGVAVAVDEHLVSRDTAVPDGATVALLPPVSGG